MLCQECEHRETCQAPCPDLEKHLRRFEADRTEMPMDPKALDWMAVNRGCAYPEIFSEPSDTRVDLWLYLDALDIKSRVVFLLHFYFDKPMDELARLLGMHRSTVERMIRRSRSLLAREIEWQRGEIKIPLAARPRRGHNKSKMSRPVRYLRPNRKGEHG